jgi:hypothetical protein
VPVKETSAKSPRRCPGLDRLEAGEALAGVLDLGFDLFVGGLGGRHGHRDAFGRGDGELGLDLDIDSVGVLGSLDELVELVDLGTRDGLQPSASTALG